MAAEAQIRLQLDPHRLGQRTHLRMAGNPTYRHTPQVQAIKAAISMVPEEDAIDSTQMATRITANANHIFRTKPLAKHLLKSDALHPSTLIVYYFGFLTGLLNNNKGISRTKRYM
jgi:hypothetical protein